jgi:hypothetical protein
MKSEEKDCERGDPTTATAPPPPPPPTAAPGPPLVEAVELLSSLIMSTAAVTAGGRQRPHQQGRHTLTEKTDVLVMKVEKSELMFILHFFHKKFVRTKKLLTFDLRSIFDTFLTEEDEHALLFFNTFATHSSFNDFTLSLLVFKLKTFFWFTLYF